MHSYRNRVSNDPDCMARMNHDQAQVTGRMPHVPDEGVLAEELRQIPSPRRGTSRLVS
jgi:hypothetical protein